MSERRRQYFIDQKVQGNLLAVLVIVQLGLVSVLLLILYGDINTLIEEHIYRIHSKGVNSWLEILRLLAITMTTFLALNIFLLYVAHTAWSRYIKKIISQFSLVLDHIMKREFSDSMLPVKSGHPMMQLVQQWYTEEKQRRLEIDGLLDELTGYMNTDFTQNDRMELQKTLENYRQLLNSR